MTCTIAAVTLLMASTLAFALDINETSDAISIDARRDIKTYPCSRQKAIPSVKWESGCFFVSYTCRKLNPSRLM